MAPLRCWWCGALLSLALAAAALRNDTSDATPDIRVIGKVTTMLEQMRARSQELKAQADAERAQNVVLCNSTQASTQESLDQLKIEVETLESDIGTLEVEKAQLSSEITERQTEYLQLGVQLESLRLEHSNATQAFKQDLVTYSMAVEALDRAIELLEQETGAAAALVSLRHLAASGRRGGSAARRIGRALGLAGAAPTWDTSVLPSIDSTPFSSQSGGVVGVLEGLRTDFKASKEELVAAEQTRMETFSSEEALLEAQMKTSATSETEQKGTLAEKEVDYLSKQQQLETSSADLKSTEAYLAGIVAECQQREAAYAEMNKLREDEIEALGKAVALISEVAGEALPVALLHLPPAGAAGHGGRIGAAAGAAEARLVVGRARTLLAQAAGRLHSASLGGLVRQLGALGGSAAAGARGAAGRADDPLAKVKTMIAELIEKLRLEANEEASHKAWCDGELEKATAAQGSAQADVLKHSAKVQQLESSIASLEVEVSGLNATLLTAQTDRNASVQQHASSLAQIESSIQDAEASAAATLAAAAILREYMANVSKALGLGQRRTSLSPGRPGRRVARLGRPRRTQGGPAQSLLGRRAAANASGQRHVAAQAPLLVPESTVAGTQSGGIGMVVSMLEAVHEGYVHAEEEAEKERAAAIQLHNQTLLEIDVMIASVEKDMQYKAEEKARYEVELPLANQSLNASSQELVDANAVYEQLKPPCLNTETREERLAKKQAEIDALKESLTMMEELQQDFGALGASLLQPAAPARRPPAAPAAAGGAAAAAERRARRAFALGEVQEPAGLRGLGAGPPAGVPRALAGVASRRAQLGRRTKDDELLAQISGFLREIKAEVVADMADDEQIYLAAHSWCQASVPEKQSILAMELAHDESLVNAIEVSTQQVQQLTVKLQQLETDLATEQAGLQQQASIRQDELEHFQASEKEMLQCISALDSALVVLSKHYNASEAQGFNATEEQRLLEAEKEKIYAEAGVNASSPNSSLLLVAGLVRRALQSAPGAAAPAPLRGAGAAGQAVLPDPMHVLRLGLGAAVQPSLAQAAAAVLSGRRGAAAGSPEGASIFGILQQLLQSFRADLQAAQAQEDQRKTDFVELQETKLGQVEAVQASITSKRQQLAHYTKVHAEAKEDLSYVRASYSADLKHLTTIQQHCTTLEGEYKIRNMTREQEVAAIDEALEVLEEAQAADNATAASNASNATGAVSTLLAGRRQASRARALERRASRRKRTRAPPSPAAVKATGVVEAYIRAHPALRAPPARARPALPELAPRGPRPPRAGALARRPAGLPGGGGARATLGEGRRPVARARQAAEAALAELASRAEDAAPATGSALSAMLADALAVVVEKIDALRSTLYEEQHAEVGHRDACVEQGNQVEQELEERTTAEQGYNSTIDRTAAMLNATAEEVSEIEGQIREMDASLVAARTGRAAEHASLKASVQEQLELQRKLRRAIQALKNFYAEKARSPGLLQAAVSASGRLPEDYAFSKGPNLEDGLAGLCFGNSTSSLQRAQLSCSREPDCFFIYDEGCDGTSWRYCAALPGNLSGSSSSGGACTMLKVEKAAPVSTTFSKPLQSHRGAQGILAMLQILLDESEQMIESITQAESQALDTYGQDVVTTQASVQEKTQQVTALNQAYSDAQVELEEAVQARAAVSREREEIVAYRAVVEEKCGPLLEHFAGSQEARAEELERLLQARQTLQGMRESAGAVGLLARRAAVAVRARAS